MDRSGGESGEIMFCFVSVEVFVKCYKTAKHLQLLEWRRHRMATVQSQNMWKLTFLLNKYMSKLRVSYSLMCAFEADCTCSCFDDVHFICQDICIYIFY